MVFNTGAALLDAIVLSVVSKEGEFSEFKINIPKTEEEQES